VGEHQGHRVRPRRDRPAADDGLKPGGYLLTASVPEEKLEGVLALLSKSGTVEFEGDDSDLGRWRRGPPARRRRGTAPRHA
jgi:hypothetical protein